MLSGIDTFKKWKIRLIVWLIVRDTLTGTPVYAIDPTFGSDDMDHTQKSKEPRLLDDMHAYES
jgi:hypothetical protein